MIWGYLDGTMLNKLMVNDESLVLNYVIDLTKSRTVFHSAKGCIVKRFDFEDQCEKEVFDSIPYNHIQVWLELIGNAENARKLRARVDRLAPPTVVDPEFGPEPSQCPTTVLYGASKSAELYADPYYRPALDMWDTGEVSPRDLKIWCLYIERGLYRK